MAKKYDDDQLVIRLQRKFYDTQERLHPNWQNGELLADYILPADFAEKLPCDAVVVHDPRGTYADRGEPRPQGSTQENTGSREMRLVQEMAKVQQAQAEEMRGLVAALVEGQKAMAAALSKSK